MAMWMFGQVNKCEAANWDWKKVGLLLGFGEWEEKLTDSKKGKEEWGQNVQKKAEI